MQVTVLGTMGWMPSDRRETTCTACRDGDELLLFDAGTGLRRLLAPAHAPLLDGVRSVHLFLSHYHLDHTCGLAYLSGVLAGRQVVLHPPEAAITGIDPQAALAGLLRRPYNPRDLADMPDVRVEPLREGGNQVAGHEIRLRRQEHSDPSVSFRVDDAFVQATDTVADPATAEFAAGVPLLLHEAWYAAPQAQAGAAAPELPAGYASHSDARARGRRGGAGRRAPPRADPPQPAARRGRLCRRGGAGAGRVPGRRAARRRRGAGHGHGLIA